MALLGTKGKSVVHINLLLPRRVLCWHEFSGRENDDGWSKKAKDMTKVKCYNCGKMGHFKDKCPGL